MEVNIRITEVDLIYSCYFRPFLFNIKTLYIISRFLNKKKKKSFASWGLQDATMRSEIGYGMMGLGKGRSVYNGVRVGVYFFGVGVGVRMA